ncbi:UNVERIFIED_CONTAM: putative E3 ubiquitin-protein ligase HERC1 [Sesamum radiatum]|uniref:E3 ubiquitin-protein ligase HERC1 n=1 Tax=Sesamum radiatum TaxID=300843 RepID=A0AAW2PYL8_SESRA
MEPVDEEKKVEEEVKGGELLFCGTTAWDAMGRRRTTLEENLVSPRGCARLWEWIFDLLPLVACLVTVWRWTLKDAVIHGAAMRYKVVRAGAGRSHSVVVTEDGLSLAFGWNKHGQLGSGSVKNEVELSPVRCLVSEVKTAVCGGDFTVWLTSIEGSSILTAGLPQYGQLGHGSNNEYNTKDSSVKLAYEAQPRPRAIASLSEKTIVKVACGTNHTVAVDKNGHVYTLGHREQKDEWTPRCVDVFTRHNVLPPDAVVSAGSANSACTAGGGQLYMWGKIKNSGDDWMYPKPLMDLSGWHLRCMDSGNMHHFVGADSSCISWGHAQSGELGYGPNGQKSSAIPKKVDILEGMHVISVACGFAHSLVVVDRTNIADQLEQLEVHDGKAVDEVVEVPDSGPAVAEKTPKKSSVKKSQNSKKRKDVESSSEDEENSEYDSDDSDEMLNGQAEHGRGAKSSGKGRGKNTGKSASGRKSNGRGRGRPPSQAKSSQSAEGKGSSRRGRPKKS